MWGKNKMYDVVIIGAGVVGSLIARELSRYQLKTCIVEKENDVAMGTSKANSAIIHAGYDCKPNTLKEKLNVEGNAMMDQLANELDVPFKRIGSLVLAFNDEDKKTIEELYHRGVSFGIKGMAIWDQKMVREHEPNLSLDVIGALYAPTAGIVCPYQLNIGATENAVDNGVALKLNTQVLSIEKREHFIINTNEEQVEASYIINAAGVYADEISHMIGDDSYKIHPRKGEYMVFDKKLGNTVSHVVFQPPSKMGKGILVTPTVDGNLMMGPTALDMDDKQDMSTTDDGLNKVKAGATKTLKDFNMRGVIKSFSGIRATGSTGDFVIGRSKIDGDFINVGAIASPGLSSAPAIATFVSDMLKDMGVSLNKNPNFNPLRKRVVRFREMTNEQREVLAKKNPAFGHMICRCESVTEGEIIDAIRRSVGAKDIDGVKRRTRAGSGRCQGGFCMPKVMEILAKELNIPITQVTKKGAGSRVLISEIKSDLGCE
jgi:glycerol-3-phosphate dehydrogenase